MLQWLPGSKTRGDLERPRGRTASSAASSTSPRERRGRSPRPIYAVSPDAPLGDRPRLPPPERHPARLRLRRHPRPEPRRRRARGRRHLADRPAHRARRNCSSPSARSPPCPTSRAEPRGAKHWFNHLLFTPDGSRFVFLHRWRGEGQGAGFTTRLITAAPDGTDLHVLDPYGKTSHFIWRDPSHILAWAWHPSHGDKFYLYEDRTDRVEVVGPGRDDRERPLHVPARRAHGSSTTPTRTGSGCSTPTSTTPRRGRSSRSATSARRRSTPASGAATRTRGSAPTAGAS